MSDVIHITIIHTDGTNLFPKPKGFEDEQVDSFYDEDAKWVEIGVRIGLKNKIYFDKSTICEDGAWIICSGPIPCSEEKLRQIVEKEKSAIWRRRSSFVSFIAEFFNPERTV